MSVGVYFSGIGLSINLDKMTHYPGKKWHEKEGKT
jgi:hypothetical protein